MFTKFSESGCCTDHFICNDMQSSVQLYKGSVSIFMAGMGTCNPQVGCCMINRAALDLNCMLYGSETHILFIQDLLGSEGPLEERLGSGSGVNALEVVCLTSKRRGLDLLA